MRWCAVGALFLALFLGVQGCGPGRGAGRRRGPRKLTPLVFKQHVPNVSENTLTASGLTEGRISKNDKRFRDLVPNYNQDIIFKDEEGTGADRLMTQRCKEKLNTLAISVMNQWPGVRLRVTEGWDEEGLHASDSLHYEGRAVDITTSDRDRSKYGMLARLAVEAGFDWVYYESRAHIHCSVKSESSQAAKYGGCFTAESRVQTPGGPKRMDELRTGDQVLAFDPQTLATSFSEVILFLDYDPSVRRSFLEFHLASGRTLRVTPAHLILSDLHLSTPSDDNNNNIVGGNFDDFSGEFGGDNATSASTTWRTVYADMLSVGSRVLVRGDDDRPLVLDTVVHVKPVMRTGIFAPLTKLGTVIVDDVAASCYASIDSARLAHWVFAPLRFVANVRESFHRMWMLMHKPVQAWSTQQQQQRPPRDAEPKQRGVHWYARILYVLGDFLLPSHLHK